MDKPIDVRNQHDIKILSINDLNITQLDKTIQLKGEGIQVVNISDHINEAKQHPIADKFIAEPENHNSFARDGKVDISRIMLERSHNTRPDIIKPSNSSRYNTYVEAISTN